MRKILFKAKRIDNGEWVEGDLSCDKYILPWNGEFYARTSYYDGMNWCECSAYEIDPSTVCQATGLTDKDGKEIFEGDIVKSVALNNDHYQRGAIVISPVEYFCGNACLSITYIPIYPFCISHDIEIIGSIHDTPKRGPDDD